MFVFIGESGSVNSLLSASALFINRTGADIVNHGQITADYRGVYFANGVTGGTLKNSGTITVNTSFAVFAGGSPNSTSGTFAIDNSGSIAGGTRGISISYQSLDLQNTGTIIGDTGVLIVSNSSASNILEVNNAGDIIGRNGTAIAAGSASDMVVNTGRIVGDVNLFGGNDTFDGRGGVVQGTVNGGLGDDTYLVSDATLLLGESAGQGIDTVKSTIGYVLADNFENLDLLGVGNTKGIGNALANTITETRATTV